MDLTTKYLGLTLKNPVVASASPLSEDIGKIRQMEDAGAGAVVLHSLFEEQAAVESDELEAGLEHSAGSEALSFFPDLAKYKFGPDLYLEHVAKAKAAVAMPVIASLNGVSVGGWVGYAKKMEQAGADALELNIYTIPTDPALTSDAVEQSYCDLVKAVKSSLRIPVAVKIGPYFSAMANFAPRLEQAGANGLVLFNRFYQPDFDLEALEAVSTLQLSTPYELLLRLHWVAVLFGKIKADMAITGGVYSAQDVLKSMMAGARVAMMTSALLKHGVGHIAEVTANLKTWMEDHEYESISQMQGSMSQRSVANQKAFLRANYLKVLSTYSLNA